MEMTIQIDSEMPSYQPLSTMMHTTLSITMQTQIRALNVSSRFFVAISSIKKEKMREISIPCFAESESPCSKVIQAQY